jgi:hypothetical protein
VHIAPWTSDAGELVLLAVTSRGTLAAPPYTIADDEDRLLAAELMDGLLERADPTFTRPRPELVQ